MKTATAYSVPMTWRTRLSKSLARQTRSTSLARTRITETLSAWNRWVAGTACVYAGDSLCGELLFNNQQARTIKQCPSSRASMFCFKTHLTVNLTRSRFCCGGLPPHKSGCGRRARVGGRSASSHHRKNAQHARRPPRVERLFVAGRLTMCALLLCLSLGIILLHILFESLDYVCMSVCVFR